MSQQVSRARQVSRADAPEQLASTSGCKQAAQVVVLGRLGRQVCN